MKKSSETGIAKPSGTLPGKRTFARVSQDFWRDARAPWSFAINSFTSYFILAVVMALLVNKGVNAQSDREIVPGKQVSGNVTAKTIRPAFTNERDVERMTDARLIREARGDNKFDVADFRTPDDFGVALENLEYWHQIRTNSVSSVADAEKEVKSVFLKQNADDYKTDFIGENDYYYQFRLRYTGEPDETHTMFLRIIVYKTSARFCSFNSKTGYYSEIRFLDRNSVLYLMDLEVFFDIYNWNSARVLYRKFEETDKEYTHTYYRISITDGDWDVNDKAVLERIKCGVDKSGGVKTCYEDSTVLKTAEISGTARKLKIIP